MQSYTSAPSDQPLLDSTIGDHFERIAAKFPDNDALIEAATGRRWSYAELNEEVDRLARGLLAMGVDKGDRIGIWSTNCAEWTILQYATAKAGAILVNVNPAYRSHELQFVAKQCGMRMLVVAPSDKNSDFVGMGREAVEACPELVELVLIDGNDDDAAAGQGEVTFAGVSARSAEV
ncbi:AMP-binding protein, partial [Arthrobacter sp. H14]|uniref:AMP-binding protein n=1 Tax=Arthrobacter sp. H14 TaxID=1312959 RepID=UPI00055B60C5